MKKHLAFMILAIFIIFGIAGCGTVPKKFKEEVGGIKSRVETLESRVEGVEAKQAETERVSSEQKEAIERLKGDEKDEIKTNIHPRMKSAKKKERTKEIQTCLKNAGFYKGEIDGVKGRATRRAIRKFQKANSLYPDGIIGKKTWRLLSKYAEGPAASSEEGATK